MEYRQADIPVQTLSEPKQPAPLPPGTDAGGNGQNAYPAGVGQAVGLLAFGLLPGLGIAICLWWAYTAGRAEKRNLAKAMLWLHGTALCAVLIFLCLWVLYLAGLW